jgi:hypothetical protein
MEVGIGNAECGNIRLRAWSMGQKTEVREQKTEGGKQRAWGKGHGAWGRMQMTELRGQKTEGMEVGIGNAEGGMGHRA